MTSVMGIKRDISHEYQRKKAGIVPRLARSGVFSCCRWRGGKSQSDGGKVICFRYLGGNRPMAVVRRVDGHASTL